MSRSRFLPFVGTVLLLAAIVQAPATAAQPADLAAELSAAIRAKVAELGVPGAIVGISVPGTIDYVTSVGVSDTATGRPMTIDDHIRIGSVTKTFTGTAILQLVDQGRIRLSDSISSYVDGVPSGDQITIDMLGRMRSGLFNYTDDADFQQRALEESPRGPDAFAVAPRDLLNYAFAHPLNFAPGSEFEYSNTNTVLLGMVVERVSGQPLGEYLQQQIFDPVALRNTSYPDNAVLPEPYGHGYAAAGPDGSVVDTTSWNPSWADAAGRIVSNYGDMKLWASALGTGASLDAQTQAQRLPADTQSAMSYGFAVFATHGWIGHNGGIPGYTTVVGYLPQRNATLVVFVNSDVPKQQPAGALATVVTSVVTPEHVFDLPAAPDSEPQTG